MRSFLIVSLIGLSVFAQDELEKKKVRFPPGFKWCLATAAHQIEGGNTNSDLWDWEQIPGKIQNGDRSDIACDHWNRVQEDVGLLKNAGVRTYRFSVEWAKIEPQPGVFDDSVILHYKDEVESLKAAGIEPFITLHHFTFPRWMRKKGGWEWEGAPEAFERFADTVYRRIGVGVRDWVTINEPLVHLAGGYLVGVMPPGETRDLNRIAPVLIGMLKAHARAYHSLHFLAAQKGFPMRVGLAHHLRTFDPASEWNPLDRLAARLIDNIWNWSFPDAVKTGELRLNLLWFMNSAEKIAGLKGTQDFIGVNYYSGDLVAFDLRKGFKTLAREELRKNDMGWDIYPKGFFRVLKKVGERYRGVPVIVTENGTADASDRFRSQFIKDHLSEMSLAISKGIPVEGYCHWSLYDNFEWNAGYFPRFGLYEMNYSTMERRPRPSLKLFSEIIRNNGF